MDMSELSHITLSIKCFWIISAALPSLYVQSDLVKYNQIISAPLMLFVLRPQSNQLISDAKAFSCSLFSSFNQNLINWFWMIRLSYTPLSVCPPDGNPNLHLSVSRTIKSWQLDVKISQTPDASSWICICVSLSDNQVHLLITVQSNFKCSLTTQRDFKMWKTRDKRTTSQSSGRCESRESFGAKTFGPS